MHLLAERLLQELTSDDDALYLVRPFADLADFGVARHPLNRIISGVSRAPQELDRLEGHPHGQLATEELGHRRLLRERLAPLFQPGGMVRQLPPGIDIRSHVRKPELH